MNTLLHHKLAKHVLASAVAIACSGAGLAHAIQVTSIQITDVGTNESPDNGIDNDCNYSSVTDGISGAFRFSNINDTTYLGASLFYGDVDAAPGTGMGVIDTSVANGHTTFTTGFLFAGSPFRPITQGPIDMDISVTGGNMVMTINSLPFAGIYGPDPNTGQVFVLPPQDPNNPSNECTYTAANAFEPLSVQWLHWIDASHVAFKIAWSHCITSAEDPIGSFVGFHAHWRLEGIATVAGVLPAPTTCTTGVVPLPEPLLDFNPKGISGGCTLNPDAKFDMVLLSLLLTSAGYLTQSRYRRKSKKQ